MLGWILFGTWVALASLGAFAATLADKRRAQRGGRRIREADLLVLALIGGSPGMAAGMAWARHKTSKIPFLAKFALLVAIQGVVLFLAIRSTT